MAGPKNAVPTIVITQPTTNATQTLDIPGPFLDPAFLHAPRRNFKTNRISLTSKYRWMPKHVFDAEMEEQRKRLAVTKAEAAREPPTTFTQILGDEVEPDAKGVKGVKFERVRRSKYESVVKRIFGRWRFFASRRR